MITMRIGVSVKAIDVTWLSDFIANTFVLCGIGSTNMVLFADSKFATFHIISRYPNEAAHGWNNCQDRRPRC